MAYLGTTTFDLLETPKWLIGKSISNLVSDICRFYNEYKRNNGAAFLEKPFTPDSAADFISYTCQGELVGLQSCGEVESTLGLFGTAESHNSHCFHSVKSETRETVNLFKALNELHSLHSKSEMEGTGLLTVQLICDTHHTLMDGLLRDCGEIRTGGAYTYCEDGLHRYPEPEISEALFYACVDHHNRHMIQLEDDLKQEVLTVDTFTAIFKCAARLLFDFVDAHPFGDGNGRMCRLLANYVLSLVTPFPVAPLTQNLNTRDEYLDAIIECRKNRSNGPGKLAAMLVYGTWVMWENYRKKSKPESNKQTISIKCG